MKNRWHYRPLISLAVAVVCILTRLLTARQGYLTTKIWGLDFGFARIKSLTFFVWFGELFRFPFDLLLLSIALLAVGVAIAATRMHFVSQRSPNPNQIIPAQP